MNRITTNLHSRVRQFIDVANARFNSLPSRMKRALVILVGLGVGAISLFIIINAIKGESSKVATMDKVGSTKSTDKWETRSKT